MQRLVIGYAAALFGLLAAMPVSAATYADEPEPKVIERTVTGTVVTATRRAVNVEFASTADSATEMMLPVTEDTMYERLKGSLDLNRGDRVKVVYEQTYLPAAEQGGDPHILKTVAKTVTLVKRATVDPLQSRNVLSNEDE